MFINDIFEDLLAIGEMDTLDIVKTFALIATFHEIDQIYAATGSGGTGENDCDCKWDISCSTLNMGLCEDDLNDCDETEEGCGFLWLFKCYGLCEIEENPN